MAGVSEICYIQQESIAANDDVGQVQKRDGNRSHFMEISVLNHANNVTMFQW